MLGFAAVAEVALAEVPPTLPPPRASVGVILYVDTVWPFSSATQFSTLPNIYGTIPVINQPFTLIINTPSGVDPAVRLHFISPTGVRHDAAVDYIFVGSAELPHAWFNQYLAYYAAPNEFNEFGTWQVSVQQEGSQGPPLSFPIVSKR